MCYSGKYHNCTLFIRGAKNRISVITDQEGICLFLGDSLMRAFAVVVTVADVFLITTFAEVLPFSPSNDPRGKGLAMNGENSVFTSRIRDSDSIENEIRTRACRVSR